MHFLLGVRQRWYVAAILQLSDSLSWRLKMRPPATRLRRLVEGGGHAHDCRRSPRFQLVRSAPHSTCVIDRDSFYLQGQSIRIADIEAPETHPSRCGYEAQVGARATCRLYQLLNAEPFQIKRGWFDRDEDIYGRKPGRVISNGKSVGGMLVAEGLAGRWVGSRQPWCA